VNGYVHLVMQMLGVTLKNILSDKAPFIEKNLYIEMIPNAIVAD
jgi:hypothetical protein